MSFSFHFKKPLLFLILLAFTFCHKDPNPPTSKDQGCSTGDFTKNDHKVTITQGIWGNVLFTEGNCMPGPDSALSSCKTCPVRRTIRVYEYTTLDQAFSKDSSGFYDSFSTKLLFECTSDGDGFFQLELPEGHYTLVSLEAGRLYWNTADGQGGISPIQVAQGVARRDVNINYKASY